MDIAKLSFHIEQILKKYRPTTIPKVLYPAFYDKISHMLQSVVNDVLAKQPSFWNAYGIRTEPPHEFKNCIFKIPKEEIGKGFYGIVYKVPVKTCIKHIPKGTEYIAMKFELINLNNTNQTPERLGETISITKKIAELGIGPQLYDVFIVESQGLYFIVKIYEYIQGDSWEVHKFKSPKSYKKAMATLTEHVKTFNKNGILHRDLHPKNVMVTPSEQIFIIDFDLASYAENFEKRDIAYFNKNSRYVNDIEIYTRHVYNELIKQKIIKLENKTFKK
jgi:serine/threonine protein kinase